MRDLETMTPEELADIVVRDLEFHGYRRITVSTTRPSYDSSQTTICLRIGSNDDGSLYDYHFMRVFSGNEWRHKPGTASYVLVYNYLPENSLIWTNEGFDGNTPYEGEITYDSDIYYISYVE